MRNYILNLVTTNTKYAHKDIKYIWLFYDTIEERDNFVKLHRSDNTNMLIFYDYKYIYYTIEELKELDISELSGLTLNQLIEIIN